MIEVAGVIAFTSDLLTKIDTTFAEGAAEVGEDLGRFGLVMNGVEGSAEVEAGLIGHGGYVLLNEAEVAQAALVRFGGGAGNNIVEHVVADEAVVGEFGGKVHQGAPATATDIE